MIANRADLELHVLAKVPFRMAYWAFVVLRRVSHRSAKIEALEMGVKLTKLARRCCGSGDVDLRYSCHLDIYGRVVRLQRQDELNTQLGLV
jgi:hypothetical protein